MTETAGVTLLLTICLQLATATAGTASLSLPALQLLESLGLPAYSLQSVTQGEQLRQQDSPIYYIKMPPTSLNSPTLPHSNAIDFHHQDFGYHHDLHQASTEFPFEQVPVDFTNNGRPEQILHWSRPSDNSWNYEPHLPSTPSTPSTSTTSTPSTTPSSTTTPSTTPSSTTTPSTTTTSTSTPKPPKLPSLAPWPPMQGKIPSKKPWVSFIKQFSSNGKPSGVYIYKSKPVHKQHKYKHPLFRHFNY
ncbi:Protein of unknown function DUF4786 [Trinorchestia longiramus]|nr:Protein of unknown function DUF4786 [Trinorchestia longiramus]